MPVKRMGNRLDTDAADRIPSGERIDWRRFRSLPVAIEALVALSLALFGLAHLVLHMHAMATTGLWNDEIASIRDFSGNGLWTTLTHYPAPNNHIFFNALNALMDWADPYQPLRARAWSFAAMGALFGIGVFGFARRGSFLEAGLYAHLVFMSSELIALGLHARGYGLMALFTLLTALCVWRHEREPARPARLTIGGDEDNHDQTAFRQNLSQVLLRRLVAQVSHKDRGRNRELSYLCS